MLEQELKNIWNNSSRTAHISIETNQLIEELNAKVSNIQKKIRIRDTREMAASVIGIFLFGYLLYEIPFPITKGACAFAILWFVLVIFKFRKSKLESTTSQLPLSITEQFAHQEKMMQKQADLLDSVAYWYAIPPFLMNFLFILGLGNPSDYNWTNSLSENLLPLTANFKTVLLIGLALFYSFTIWFNKRAANKDIKPLLESIQSMRLQLRHE